MRRPQRVIRFTRPSASAQNETLRLITELQDAVQAIVRGDAVQGFVLHPMEVTALNPDRTLTCVYQGLSAAPGATQYTVSLPAVFTEAARDGVNYTYTDLNTRTADDGNDTETQKITPAFVIGDKIIAHRSSVPLAGFEFISDGRMWAKVET